MLGLPCFGVCAFNCRNIQRRGHKINDSIQQLLHAFVFIRSTACDRHHLHSNGCPANCGLDLVGRNLFSLEIHFHDLIVKVGHCFKKILTIGIGQVTHILRNRLNTHILPEIVIINDRVHIHEIDNPFEGFLRPDRKLNRNRVALQPVMDHIKDVIEISSHNVHLVHVDHTRNVIVVGLSPDRFRLGFNAALGTEDRHTAVQHSQRALNLCGKVHMARGIDDVDAGILPETGGSSRSDGDASLLLLLHPVHRGSAFMGLTELVINPGVEQNAFCRCCLTGIDVSHDPDISCLVKRIFSRHLNVNSCWNYHLKCAKALLASAFLCMSSRFFTAEPVLLHASMISPARRSFMVFSPRLRE